jgi:ATP-dependent Clp protease adaptor protein ClpS
MQSPDSSALNPDILIEEDKATDYGNYFQLLIWNDDINTFDWVIKALVDICGHSPEQAEQCALLVHYKGKYPVCSGTMQKLRPLCNSILQRKIGASIEEQS